MTGTPTLTTLVSFTGAGDEGSVPMGSLIADAKGDLFGTTEFRGANDDGTVFEIAKTAGGYASTPITLVSFNDADDEPFAGLIADSNGDLFGTTRFGGANGDGTVFEIVKTAGGYANTPTTLVSFDGTNGAVPESSLIADSKGDLFGTTAGGTAFQIVKTAGGYASTPTTLVSFNGTTGVPQGSLIADSNGDLFGTTDDGGANGDGTVFEIVKTAGGYASTPTTLVSFDGANGDSPEDSLIADSNGDLFGTTDLGDGTVFEIAKTAGGYASTPTTLVSFNGTDGEAPLSSLIANANGDLFGTTEDGGGTVFEITDSGFEAPPPPPPPADLLWQNTSGQASIWEMDGNKLTGGGPVSPNPGQSWRAVGTGDFFAGGSSGILWQNASTDQISIWEMNGNSVIGGWHVTAIPGPNPDWRAVGVGDFDGDSLSDILWQNTTTGQAMIWNMNGNTLKGGAAVNPNPGPAWKGSERVTSIRTAIPTSCGRTPAPARSRSGKLATTVWSAAGP